MRIVVCTAIDKVSFIWKRTQPSILRLSIYISCTILIRCILEDGQLKLENIHTSQNLVNMLTKVITREKLSSC
jgi:hypothetical protein